MTEQERKAEIARIRLLLKVPVPSKAMQQKYGITGITAMPGHVCSFFVDNIKAWLTHYPSTDYGWGQYRYGRGL